jgi:hypothetical protein
MKDRQQKGDAGSRNSGSGKVQGEGDYESARVYKKDIDEFVATRKGEIPELAKKAEEALGGPEGAELKEAEEKGKSKARR